VKDTNHKGMSNMNREALVAEIIKVMGDAPIWFGSHRFEEMAEELNCLTSNGATRRVFIFPKLGIVIKFPYSEYDYCKQEVDFYESAKEYGVEKLLLPIEKVGVTKGGIPLYIQPIYKYTVEEMEWDKKDKVRKRTRKTRNHKIIRKIARGCYYSPDSEWVTRATQLYGKKFMLSFENWTKAHRVNDLHDQNVGYIGNFRPVLIDYAGYNNWQ
jgi:hypothetical protein